MKTLLYSYFCFLVMFNLAKASSQSCPWQKAIVSMPKHSFCPPSNNIASLCKPPNPKTEPGPGLEAIFHIHYVCPLRSAEEIKYHTRHTNM